VNDQQLMEAVRLACLEESLTQMPQGLATEVGERGERLSGGQRQAVAIARALTRRPQLLLLDEPSSMMDPATENQLINNLRGMKDVTLLLVTHRTAMLPLVDRLVLLDQGRVVLDGPRDEVLKRLQATMAKTDGEAS
jgi:ATP-binding cassette subfamily C protein LapB